MELAGGHDPGGADGLAGLQQPARGLRGGVGGEHEGGPRCEMCRLKAAWCVQTFFQGHQILIKILKDTNL